MDDPDAQPDFVFHVPPELETGTYANILAVWHSPHEFTLDFAVTNQSVSAGENGPVTVPCSTVARVKVAPSVLFDLLRALNQNMTQYENEYGEIQRPGEPPAEGDG
jgi:hypothetical protein